MNSSNRPIECYLLTSFEHFKLKAYKKHSKCEKSAEQLKYCLKIEKDTLRHYKKKPGQKLPAPKVSLTVINKSSQMEGFDTSLQQISKADFICGSSWTKSVKFVNDCLLGVTHPPRIMRATSVMGRITKFSLTCL